MQIARFHIYKGVMNGAIPSFHNMPILNMIFTWMRDHLRLRGIYPMEGRHENRTQAKIAQYIIDDTVNWAIAAAIHTPGGPCYNDDMEMNLWLRVSPLLYPTLQLIFWNIMALGHMWVSTHIKHVLVAMLKVCDYNWDREKSAAQICHEDTDSKITWRKRVRFLTEEEQEIRNVRHEEQNRIYDIGNNNNNNKKDKNGDKEFLIDLNYVVTNDTEAFWNSVSNAMEPIHRQAPSWIRMMIMNTATKQSISSTEDIKLSSIIDIPYSRQSNLLSISQFPVRVFPALRSVSSSISALSG